MGGRLFLLVDGRSARAEMDKPLGSGGKNPSRGVWGKPRSDLSILGLTGGTDIILVRSKAGEWRIGIERVSLAEGVGSPTLLEVRPFKNEEGRDATFSDNFGLRLADGESSIALSLSRSMLPGDAITGDNLLLDNRVPRAE